MIYKKVFIISREYNKIVVSWLVGWLVGWLVSWLVDRVGR